MFVVFLNSFLVFVYVFAVLVPPISNFRYVRTYRFQHLYAYTCPKTEGPTRIVTEFRTTLMAGDEVRECFGTWKLSEVEDVPVGSFVCRN